MWTRYLSLLPSQRGWLAAFGVGSASGMAKSKSKTKTAIYHPPKKGMPFLVVTVSPEGVVAIAVESKEEARVLAWKKTLKVLLEDNTAEQQA
jgi:hypothetical protein